MMGTQNTCFVVHTMVRSFHPVLLIFHHLLKLSQSDAWAFSLGFGFPDSLGTMLCLSLSD